MDLSFQDELSIYIPTLVQLLDDLDDITVQAASALEVLCENHSKPPKKNITPLILMNCE